MRDIDYISKMQPGSTRFWEIICQPAPLIYAYVKLELKSFGWI